MSDRQPNFAVGDTVMHLGYQGIVKRVILAAKGKYSYRVEFPHNTLTIPEGKLRRG